MFKLNSLNCSNLFKLIIISVTFHSYAATTSDSSCLSNNVGYAISTKYHAFAIMHGTIENNRANLTVDTHVYPYPLDKPSTTTIIATIDPLNTNKCVEGVQIKNGTEKSDFTVSECTLNNGILSGNYATKGYHKGSKVDEGVISVNIPLSK